MERTHPMTLHMGRKSYGVSLAIWDHTVLPVPKQVNTPRVNSHKDRPVLDLPTPEGWKAEFT